MWDWIMLATIQPHYLTHTGLVCEKNPVANVGRVVTIVPAGLLTLLLLAGSTVTNAQVPIFPENIQFPSLSNLGLATVVKNITFSIKFLLWVVLMGIYR
jgi:hypothetical protein